MTQNEFAKYHNDLVRVEKLYETEGATPFVSSLFRNLYKQKFNADMYGTPYTSIFEEA